MDAFLAIYMYVALCGCSRPIVDIDQSIWHSILYIFDTPIKRYILPRSNRAFLDDIHIVVYIIYCLFGNAIAVITSNGLNIFLMDS